MEIKLGENFIISSDEYNWVLKERKVAKESSNEYLVTLGYFGRIEQLANNVLQRHLKDSEADSIQELRKTLQQAEKHLTIEIKNEVKS